MDLVLREAGTDTHTCAHSHTQSTGGDLPALKARSVVLAEFWAKGRPDVLLVCRSWALTVRFWGKLLSTLALLHLTGPELHNGCGKQPLLRPFSANTTEHQNIIDSSGMPN